MLVWHNNWLNAYASLGLTYGSHDVNAYLPASLQMDKIKADIDTTSLTADVRLEAKFQNTKGFAIMPHLGYRFTSLKLDSYDAKVAGSDLAHYKSARQSISQIPVGVTFSANKTIKGGWAINPIVDISYTATLGDVKSKSKFNFDKFSSSESITRRTVDRNSINGIMGISLERGNVSFGVNYGTSISKHEQNHKVNATFVWKF